MGKRLTEEQKEEIIKLFASGVKVDDLSFQFNCTKFTISRNIKKKIGEEKYNSLLIRNKLKNNKSSVHKIEKQDQNKILKNNRRNSNKTDYIQDDINQII